MSTIDAKELERLKALEQAATPGPWNAVNVHGIAIVRAETEAVADAGPDHANAAFIAAARTALPALVAEVERQAKVIAAWAEHRAAEREVDAAAAVSPPTLVSIEAYEVAHDRFDAACIVLRALGEQP